MTTETIGKAGGLYCYMITPFTKDGDIDHNAMERYVDEVIAVGVDGVTCVASTTEGPYLTESERFDIVQTVCDVARNRVPVNVGIGALSTRQSLHYAEQAQNAGASTLMLEMQSYMPEIKFSAIKQHYADIANASTVPIRLYNIPRTTRIDLLPEQIAEMADIDGIDSVKDASGIATRVRDIKSLTGDRFSFYCGLHFVAMESYDYGAIGWEGALHPLFGKEMVELHQLLRARNFEAGLALYKRLEPLFIFFRTYGVPQCIKAMSEWSDNKLGSPRKPLSELTELQSAQLKLILQNLGCLE